MNASTEVPSESAAPSRRLGSRPRRALRDARILEQVQNGRDYDDIARAEQLSLRRVRAIVAKAMKARGGDIFNNHVDLQRLRLAPSLRLAAEAVASGDLRGIDRVLRLLDRLDRYNSVAVVQQDDREELRRTLFERIGRAARRSDRAREIAERRHRNALSRLATLGFDEEAACADLPAREGEAPDPGEKTLAELEAAASEPWRKWVSPEMQSND